MIRYSSLSLDIYFALEDSFVLVGLLEPIENDRSNIVGVLLGLDRNHSLDSAHMDLSAIRVVVHYSHLLQLLLGVRLHHVTVTVTLLRQSFALYLPIVRPVHHRVLVPRSVNLILLLPLHKLLCSLFILTLSHFVFLLFYHSFCLPSLICLITLLLFYYCYLFIPILKVIYL